MTTLSWRRTMSERCRSRCARRSCRISSGLFTRREKQHDPHSPPCPRFPRHPGRLRHHGARIDPQGVARAFRQRRASSGASSGNGRRGGGFRHAARGGEVEEEPQQPVREVWEAGAMTRDEAIQRLCALQTEVNEKVFHHETSSDCFCGKGGFWDSPSYTEAG